LISKQILWKRETKKMSANQEVNVLGIDISKAKFDVALLKGEAKIKNKVFANNLEGFTELQTWLTS
jgi:transposase